MRKHGTKTTPVTTTMALKLPILSKYRQVSKYAVLLSKFSFPKKGKNKSRVRMVVVLSFPSDKINYSELT